MMRGILSAGLFFSGLQLSRAVEVYLNPHQTFLRSTLEPEDASSALSRHLGVEIFEPFRDATLEEPFVGEGSYSALLLTMDELDAKAVLPHVLQASFTLSAPPSISVPSLSSVISTYLSRARNSYSSLFGGDGSSSYSEQIRALSSFLDSPADPVFAAIELAALAALREAHGIASKEYTRAVEETRALLLRTIDRTDKVHLAVLTYAASTQRSFSKRGPDPQQSQSPLPNRPPPQEPIGSVSTCFTTANACTNGTNACSGRGQCVEASKSGRTCFICACGVTKTGQGAQVKTDTWVGQSCERKDISGPFVLLTGTVLVIILLIFGSVSLLYSVGDGELPSTLLGTAVIARKD